MKKRNIVITVIICVCLLISSVGCVHSPYDDYSGSINDINVSLMNEINHYSPDLFYAYCDYVDYYVKNDDEINAMSYLDKAVNEYNKIVDINTLVQAAYFSDTTDEYYADEYEYIDKINQSAGNRISEVLSLIIQTYPESAENYFNNDWIMEAYADVSVPDELSELQYKEIELMQEYYDLNNLIDSYTYEYNGVEYSYYDLSFDLKDELGTDAYNEIKTDLFRQYNESMGDVFIELVKVRDQIAEINGYDSYSVYADENIYHRDYSTEELQTLYSVIKPIAYKYQSIIYDEPTGIDLFSLSGLLEFESKVVTGLSDYTIDAFDKLIEDNLLIATDSLLSMNGGYDVNLYTDNTSLIYLRLEGGIYDFQCLTHELGHFTEAIVNSDTDSPFNKLSYDVAEVHSTGNEMLAVGVVDEYLNDKSADTIKAYEINDKLYCVVYGCIYDEWLRYIFDNPDLTLEEINESFYKIALEYGLEDTESLRYSWTYLSHNFECPQYYISYGTSALVSLQIYELAETDRDAAIDAWNYFVECGVSASFLETTEEAGLIPFTDYEYTVELFNRCAEEEKAIEDKYGYKSY